MKATYNGTHYTVLTRRDGRHTIMRETDGATGTYSSDGLYLSGEDFGSRVAGAVLPRTLSATMAWSREALQGVL